MAWYNRGVGKKYQRIVKSIKINRDIDTFYLGYYIELMLISENLTKLYKNFIKE